MLNPVAALGVIMLILAMMARLALLSVADLTFVLPTTAVGYVLAAILGKLVLFEQVSAGRWAGTLLIFIGAVMVGSTARNTTAMTAAAPGVSK